MPRPKALYPSYRLHKRSGQAIVTLGDRMVYLGEFGTNESRAEYDRVVREWVVQGRPKVAIDPSIGVGITLKELVLAYWSHCRTYYVKDGRATDEQVCIKSALRPLLDPYGPSAVSEFTPLALKACREQMIVSGWCRRHINKQVCRVRQMFKWGVAEGMVPVAVWHALQALEGLKRGRTDAAVKDALELHELRRQQGAAPAQLQAPPARRGSLVDPQVVRIQNLLSRYPKITVRRIQEELQGHGYAGGYSILCERVAQLRPQPQTPWIERFETG